MTLTDLEAHAGMHGRLDTAGAAAKFMLGGNATVTLRSQKSGTRFTFKIRANDDATAFFVGLLNGPDNESNYAYVGRIAGERFWQGRKVSKPGDVGCDAPSSKAFAWAWRAIAQGVMPDQLEIWHEGQCGRCGRKLTVPKSIASGFGPECITKI